MKIQFGWNGFFEKNFKSNYNEEFIPGRVIDDLANSYKIITEQGEFHFDKESSHFKPVVGDFIVINKQNQNSIHNVFPRMSYYKKVDGNILAANVDTIFIVHSLPNLDSKKIEKREMFGLF